MISEILYGFISEFTNAINTVRPMLRYTMYILVTLNIAWLGINIALNKIRNEEIIEKIFVLLVTIFLINNYVYIGNVLKTGIVSLSGASSGFDESIIEYPEQVFSFVHKDILIPYTDSYEKIISSQPDEDLGWAGRIFEGLIKTLKGLQVTIMFIFFSVVVYLCVIVVVVQIVLTHINFYITLFFGQITITATLFEPFKFIGKNAISSILTSALTLGVTVFVSTLGLSVLRTQFLAAGFTISTSFVESLGYQWLTIASLIIYAFLVMRAPTLILSIISGAPALGAGGLFSMVSNIANTAVSAVRVVGGMVAGGPAGGAAAASGGGGSGGGSKGGGGGSGGGGKAAATAPQGDSGAKSGFSPSTLLNTVNSFTGIGGGSQKQQGDNT